MTLLAQDRKLNGETVTLKSATGGLTPKMGGSRAAVEINGSLKLLMFLIEK